MREQLVHISVCDAEYRVAISELARGKRYESEAHDEPNEMHFFLFNKMIRGIILLVALAGVAVMADEEGFFSEETQVI